MSKEQYGALEKTIKMFIQKKTTGANWKKSGNLGLYNFN